MQKGLLEMKDLNIKARTLVFGLKRLIDETDNEIKKAIEHKDWSSAASKESYKNGLSLAFEMAKIQFAGCLNYEKEAK